MTGPITTPDAAAAPAPRTCQPPGSSTFGPPREPSAPERARPTTPLELDAQRPSSAARTAARCPSSIMATSRSNTSERESPASA